MIGHVSAAGDPRTGPERAVEFGFVAVPWEPGPEQEGAFPFICHPFRPPQLVARVLKRG